ncbi:hypothetical protein EIP86_005990 [Pleurotus ostreatoroseus]|nr:hypothetical protein EIP86_005990 [Pleurotus ostreatoroseus]
MPPQVKFNSFGIPFVVEFANVTFRRAKRRSDVPPPPPPKDYPSRISYQRLSVASDWVVVSPPPTTPAVWAASSSTMSVASSATLYPTLEPQQVEGKALYIRFASEGPNAPMPGPPLSAPRIEQLKRRLARAVLAAGMTQSPSTQLTKAGPVIETDNAHGRGSLFRGTYGQVEEAIIAAGLTARRCDESLPATRLGVMFVMQPNKYGEIELVRVTLFA